MKLVLDDAWTATVTDEPLPFTPRYDFPGQCVRIAKYSNVVEWDQFLRDTFGSAELLWDAPDELRFDPNSRELIGAAFRLPHYSSDPEDRIRVPSAPVARPGGLRADEARDFRLEMAGDLCRAPEDAVLTCLRDLDVLSDSLDARIGIAPDVALLIQRGTIVGWSLTDPVRYLAVGFGAADPAPPAPSTRRLFIECMDLVTEPWIDEVQRRNPAALSRLRALDEALRSQHEDRHRIDALLALIGDLVEDYGRG